MLLRTRFRISNWASLGAVAGVAALMVHSVVESRHAAEAVAVAAHLEEEVFERALFRDEFLLLGEARPLRQWGQRTDTIRQHLARAAGSFRSAADRQLVREMGEVLERSSGLFLALADAGPPDPAQASPASDDLAAELRRRLTGRQLVMSHDLNARARQLAASAARQADATQRRLVAVLVGALAVVLAVTVYNARMALKVIATRVTALRDGADQVAAGNLAHRISMQGDDELAMLGRGFDRMTAQIQAGLAKIAAEIAERREAEAQVTRLNEELRRNMAQLEAANRELEAFSYSVSHDLRAPLRAIAGFSQAALEDYGPRLDETGRKYLRMASDAARDMGRLIDDLLGLSRVSRSEMSRGPVDLGALAREVVGGLGREEPARRVDVEIAPDLVAVGDPSLLRVVVDNLLRNAWKFTRHHPSARIRFGREPRADGDEFYVADDGAGFDMRFADKLFQPFQRLHRSGEFPGTGIGLATVNRIVRRHGGSVAASGEVEKGAVIRFTLPRTGAIHA